MKKMIASFGLLVFLCAFAPGEEPLRVHFIGNSYTGVNNLPGLLEKLAASVDGNRPVKTTRTLQGGAWLEKHWKNPKVHEAVAAGKPHVVVLQEQSQRPLYTRYKNKDGTMVNFRAVMHEHARKFDGLAKKVNAGTLFYMTWARRTGQHPEMER